MSGLTAKLADFVAGYRASEVPAGVASVVKRSVLDAFGVACLGTTRPIAEPLRRYANREAAAGPATAIGCDEKYAPGFAALYNGVLMHSEDFDDMGGGPGHATAVLLPPLLATAEELDLSGGEMIAAYVVGYELAAALKTPLAMDRPFHPTGILGAMGATAGCAWLRRLPAGQVRMALGIAASSASGVTRNFGTFTKPLHAGHTGRDAVEAAALAEMGWTADPDVIESPHGFADAFGGERCNLTGADFGLGRVYRLAAAPPAIKAWPSCGGNHPTLAALFEIMAGTPFEADEVESVEITLPAPPERSALFRLDPRAPLEAKFSLAFNVAAALLDRTVDERTFTAGGFERVRASGLMDRVRATVGRDAQLWTGRVASGRPHYAQVTVALRDGRRLNARCERNLGPGLEGEAVDQKFFRNAGPVLGQERAAELRGAVQNLEHLKARDLARLLASPTATMVKS